MEQRERTLRTWLVDCVQAGVCGPWGGPGCRGRPCPPLTNQLQCQDTVWHRPLDVVVARGCVIISSKKVGLGGEYTITARSVCPRSEVPGRTMKSFKFLHLGTLSLWREETGSRFPCKMRLNRDESQMLVRPPALPLSEDQRAFVAQSQVR